MIAYQQKVCACLFALKQRFSFMMLVDNYCTIDDQIFVYRLPDFLVVERNSTSLPVWTLIIIVVPVAVAVFTIILIVLMLLFCCIGK